MNIVNILDSIAREDRRGFFRIDDKVNLSYKGVDEQAVFSTSLAGEDLLSNFSLVTALDALDQESRLIMHRIEKKEPEIAEYLKILDSKISLLAQSFFRQEAEFSENNECYVNLSASGLAFECNEAIKENEFLEVKLLLTSCLAVIAIYGKVVYYKKNPNESKTTPYLVGIEYVNLQEQDREALIKHVVKRQMKQIREDRAN